MSTFTVPFVRILLAVLALWSLSTTAHGSEDFSETIEAFRSSPVVEKFFSDSYGYAVFPTIGKGGFGIGGAHGKGQVYKDGTVTGTTSMTQVTIGFQVGGQAFSQIIFFQDKRAYSEFTSGNFEFGAQASAVAITVGAQAQAGSTGSSAGASSGSKESGPQSAKYNNGMVTFTHTSGGLMYEASVGGQKFKYKAL
jgi:lipid-binding SYLF domain-containing protein